MAKKAKRFNVLSPDGFAIEFDKDYGSTQEAETAFAIWKKRYEKQGYYSSNRGRISLDVLADYCELVEV